MSKKFSLPVVAGDSNQIDLEARQGTLKHILKVLEGFTSELELHPDAPTIRLEGRPIVWVGHEWQEENDQHVQQCRNIRYVFPMNRFDLSGLFDFPLTPAAEEAVEEWLMSLVNMLDESWTNQ